MDSKLLAPSTRAATASSAPSARTGWLTGRQGRRTREALLAYAFLFPAFLIIGVFGIFPLFFAAYESTLVGLNKIVGNYDGMGNYVKAIGNLAYVVGFWLAAIALFWVVRSVTQARRQAAAKNEPLWSWLLPGLLTGGGLVLFLVFIFRFVPALLLIPTQLRGPANTPENFRRLVVETWWSAPVQTAFWVSILTLAAGLAFASFVGRRAPHAANYLGVFTSATFAAITAALIGWLTWAQVQRDIGLAAEAGTNLNIWSQLLLISAGFILLLLAWWLWESASSRSTNRGMVTRLAAAAALMVGAWVLIGELPAAVGTGDRVWWNGLAATVWYSLFTIPAQLAISLLFAVLLFQDIKGRGFFRLVYFIPYIAPFVGTAAVFRIIFSAQPTGLINRMLSVFNLPTLKWLAEPQGLFQLMTGQGISMPEWAVGPSLALVVIMIYGVWSFFGFNTVIFMAGLGNIPRELYEAASIDGGGRWAHFRHITLPLLSPTIYFLTLYSVIGTFKAFNHIYVLRTAAALGTTDTASVVIFQTFKRDTRIGYASAMAVLLLLIIFALTYVNNRIASKRVFYG